MNADVKKRRSLPNKTSVDGDDFKNRIRLIHAEIKEREQRLDEIKSEFTVTGNPNTDSEDEVNQALYAEQAELNPSNTPVLIELLNFEGTPLEIPAVFRFKHNQGISYIPGSICLNDEGYTTSTTLDLYSDIKSVSDAAIKFTQRSQNFKAGSKTIAQKKRVLPAKGKLPPKTSEESEEDPSLGGMVPPADLDHGDEEELEAAPATKIPRGMKVSKRKQIIPISAVRAAVNSDDDVIDETSDINEGGSIEAGSAPGLIPSVDSIFYGDIFALPDEVEAHYLVKKSNNKQELFRRNERVPAIIDKGDSLRSLGSDAATVSDIVAIAIHRDWSVLKLKGSKDFKREAWIEATARGLSVEGYKPTEIDVSAAIKRGQSFGEQVEQIAERGGDRNRPKRLEIDMKNYDNEALKEMHVLAKPTDLWFDLGPYGAKLERLPVNEHSSEYYLRLEMPEKEFKSEISEGQLRDRVEAAGWVNSKEPAAKGMVAIETYQSAQSAREIAQKVDVWFDYDKMKTAHKPLRDHVETPRVYGLEKANTQSILKQLVAGVDLGDKTRMQNTMGLCLNKMTQMRSKANQTLFSGNGQKVFTRLAEHLVARSENPWPEVEAAAFIRSRMEAAGDNPRDQTAKMMTELGQLLRDGEADASSMMVDGILRDTERYSVEDVKNHPSVDEDVFERIKKDVELARVSGNVISPNDIALGQMIGASYLSAASMSSNPSITRSNAPDILDKAKATLPFDVRADGSTPTVQVAQNVSAIGKALSVAASSVGRSPDNLLKDNSSFFMRLSNDNVAADRGIVGYHTSVAADDDGASIHAIAGSAHSGRSFIHELGHAVSRSWGFTDAEKDACLMKSGVSAKIHDEIDARFPTGDVENRGYYRDPEEIFARMFDAHVCNVVREGGDASLESIGGAYTTCGYDIGAPHGNITATTAFMDEVNATIGRKLSAENAAHLDQKNSAENGQSTGPN